MREIVKTNEPVVLSYIEALMRGANITILVADRNMALMEGSIGIIPRRVLVDEGQWDEALDVLKEAGLEEWISFDD